MSTSSSSWASSNTGDALTLFKGTLVLPDSLMPKGAVLVRDGVIVWVGMASKLPAQIDGVTGKPDAMKTIAATIDVGDDYISPGFVDIHTHGGGGADFMDATPQAMRTANRAHAKHGTTTIYPTTTTGTPQQLVNMLDVSQVAMDSWQVSEGARVGGVHWYGPYFATDKVGAHPKGYERYPDPSEYEPALASGIIKSATCAAELPGAVDFCKAATAAGCLVTCGHSNASWSEMAAAYDAGLRHVDHFWNAMSSTDTIRKRLGSPQQGSMAEFVLYHQEMSTEVIADGHHHAPEMHQFAYRMLGPDRLVLVSDCSRAMDMPAGEYRIGHHETGEPFLSNEECGTLLDGVTLASSALPIEHMVRIFARDTGAQLYEVIRMASLTPARLVHADDCCGSLAAGKRADIAILSKTLHVQQTYLAGQKFE